MHHLEDGPTAMFTRAPNDQRAIVRIFVGDTAVEARAGDSVAAALLASGLDVRRATAVTGAKRLPYCMMGVCFDCLVSIDGVGNRQGCMVQVAEGMQIDIQQGKREIGR
jgi:sarcosine oxidase subunit alpha